LRGESGWCAQRVPGNAPRGNDGAQDPVNFKGGLHDVSSTHLCRRLHPGTSTSTTIVHKNGDVVVDEGGRCMAALPAHNPQCNGIMVRG
jgi:hypothetical protein